MLKVCPQCSAEVLESAQECFSCGLIFSEWVETQEPESEKRFSRFSKNQESRHPKELSLGDLIEDRFTVQSRVESHGLWVLYRVLDQKDGRSRMMQMGSQSHQSVQEVISSISILGEEYFIPSVLGVGSAPAPFFIFEDCEDITLLDWKSTFPSMRQRRDFCTQMLFVFVQLSRQGISFGKWDMSRIFVHERGYIWIHPSSLRGSNSQENTKLLEWMYWMLSDRVQSLEKSRFSLSGLSLRDAHWMRMMVRRKPSSHQLRNSWHQFSNIDYGMDAALARQLYEQFSQEFVLCEHRKEISFELTYACEKNLVYGTEFCHKGLVVGYVDRVLLAWEGLHFDAEVPELNLMYQRLVLDEEVRLFQEAPANFEQLLVHLKVEYLLRLDWERTLVRVLEHAQSFEDWMEVNRFRVLFGVQKEKIVVPKPQSVREHLALASFFYWFANDEEEALMWFDEAAELAREDAFDFLLLLESHTAMFGIPSLESFAELRELGLLYGLKEQLILLGNLEDRLGVLDEEWLQRCQVMGTEDRILWCKSRYATQAEVDEINQYAQALQQELLTFSIVFEDIQLDSILECEAVLAQQLNWLARLHQRNKIYEEEGFPIPTWNPPFSNEQDVAHQKDLARLLEERRMRQEENYRKERAEMEQREGYSILVMIFVALGLVWFLS